MLLEYTGFARGALKGIQGVLEYTGSTRVYRVYFKGIRAY